MPKISGFLFLAQVLTILCPVLEPRTAVYRDISGLFFFKSHLIVTKSNFVTGARIAVLLCTETTQKIYRGGAKMDFFSRSRYYNKNYGYPSTSDEGYFFSETVDIYEFYPVESTLSESFI